jgi:hypothetical protein
MERSTPYAGMIIFIADTTNNCPEDRNYLLKDIAIELMQKVGREHGYTVRMNRQDPV